MMNRGQVVYTQKLGRHTLTIVSEVISDVSDLRQYD